MPAKYPFVNKPLTLEVWNDYSAKQKWDIMVALRGPDCHEARDGIKQFTASVVRGKMIHVMQALQMRVGGQINQDLGLMITPDQRGGFLWNAQHFFEHQEEAGQYLAIPLLKVPKDTYLHHMEIMFSTSHGAALASLHDSIVDVNAIVNYFKKGLMTLRAYCNANGYPTKVGKWEQVSQEVPADEGSPDAPPPSIVLKPKMTTMQALQAGFPEPFQWKTLKMDPQGDFIVGGGQVSPAPPSPASSQVKAGGE